jgi:SAM-dependent methyltransferase
MSTIHLAPQDAVLVHQDVKSKKSYGIYWGSFRLSPEDVNEPPKLLMEEAKRQKLDAGSIEVVEIGQSVFVPVQVSTRNIGSEEESKPGTTHDERLPESKLGTKEHWDSVYAREVANFYDIGEEGEVWFGEDAVMRMIRFLEQFFQTETRFSSGGNAPTVLDLGTGNGHLLFEMLESSADLDEVLAAERMLGVDYSETSIELARAIGAKRGADCEKVMFRAADLLDPAQVAALNHVPTEQLDATEEQWDLVCDKGTMDAIALSSQPVRGEMPIDAYSRAVAQLVRKNGIFLITSCNFTQTEVTDRFTQLGFAIESIIPTPSFTFGGAKGSSTTTIAFRKL